MKEQIDSIPKTGITWPQGAKIEVGPDVDFVYIMRKDGAYTMSPIAHKMAGDYHCNEEVLSQTLLEEYDTFFAKLADICMWGYASKGSFELHIFDPGELYSAVKRKSDGLPIVSLDPLMKHGVYEFGVSRGYYLGGIKDFGQVARPGYSTLFDQSHEIENSVKGSQVSVSEDDIFSGGSVTASLHALLDSGVDIKKVIPGIQIGKPKKLSDMGLCVDPVVAYETTDGADIFNKLDLGDPRDYLLGASGLVIQLPNGELGRAPYILPFVSTTARAGIPAEIEKEFSLKVLQANLEFSDAVQTKVGKPICLKHMDHSFSVYMHQMYGVDANTEMSRVTAWLMDNIDGFWETTKKQGEFQEQLASLSMPHKVVFLDVNGTLFLDESKDGYIAKKDIQSLKNAIAQAKEKSFSVGVCSDSPLPQLMNFAEKLGIDGPILAENGNILSYANQSIILHSLSGIDLLKEQIGTVAHELGFQKIDDCIAPEFGGHPLNNPDTHWSFGANRKTSVTVFGPAQLIEKLGVHTEAHQEGVSIDCSPEYNYFALHPGKNYKEHKGLILDILSDYGYTVGMIGNSLSDWVEQDHGVTCMFVNGARISADVIKKSGYISDKPTVKGVIDILEKIQ